MVLLHLFLPSGKTFALAGFGGVERRRKKVSDEVSLLW